MRKPKLEEEKNIYLRISLHNLSVHEGKLIGCSHNQSCVGVWVVDISRIEAYAVGNAKRVNGHSEPKSRSATRNVPGTPHRVNLNTARRTTQQSSVTVPSVAAPKRSSARANSAINVSIFSKSDVVPVVVPRNDIRVEQAAELRKEVGISERSLEQVTESKKEVGMTGRSLESSQPVAESRKEVGMVGRTSGQGADSRKELGIVGRTMPFSLHSKKSSFRKFQNSREDMDQPVISALPETAGSKAAEFSSALERTTFLSVKGSIHGMSAAEMNAREDGCIGFGKSEPNSVLELPSSYRDENCIFSEL
ncbi:hypothetical protein F3Y22_tig00110403pilonHSYRG00237 [Hibiscus syriacus]|uniref:Uncharacterized protein n=1 Tax=Hibiscus syriacus TaxID=106335 RepID=A0A6A3ATL3_HIBSY|nr:hypothetical protein F3Y22_tig00110403pilonHSYRG00237 [Hibiscus syriacus]